MDLLHLHNHLLLNNPALHKYLLHLPLLLQQHKIIIIINPPIQQPLYLHCFSKMLDECIMIEHQEQLHGIQPFQVHLHGVLEEEPITQHPHPHPIIIIIIITVQRPHHRPRIIIIVTIIPNNLLELILVKLIPWTLIWIRDIQIHIFKRKKNIYTLISSLTYIHHSII
ncbi:hypothetical protein BDA99DRAFT_172072 [Phascolomyces articulosus]|uniref:Uncharacterized protein n=1 Tax=Phascolomyces articulosus TaxID=60185 RepID=A0AAD5JTC7_9FUNG|nr:hypothetical protein BDA99DRAFT_172072 [Phascolomyces articulosus]